MLHYLLRRECQRNANHRAGYARITQQPPQGLSLTVACDDWLAVGTRCDRHRRDARAISGGVAMKEIENAMLAGIHTGGEARPRHRRLGRIGRMHARIEPPVKDLPEIGHPSRLEKGF